MDGYIVGIDPGKHGAVAVYSAPSRSLEDVSDIPLIKVTKKSKQFQEVDWFSYTQWLRQILLFWGKPLMLVVEKVGAMPKQGTASMFAFGDVSGAQRELARYILQPRCFENPVPGVWKRAMGLGTETGDILKKTESYFTQQSIRFRGPRGAILDGRCEAAMLAAYGHKLLAEK